MEKKENKNILILFVIFIISLFTILCFSTSTSPIYKNYYEDDSSIFIVMGKAMKQGLVPYKDVFDHKGPVFFAIQLLGQIIYEGRLGMFILQVISLFITNIFIYKNARFFCSKLKSIFTILISMCFFIFFIEEGNLSEEFSLPILAFGVYLTLRWIIKDKKANISLIYPIVFGILFSLLAFIRLNNAIVICGLCFGIVIKLIREKRIKELFKCIIGFIIGSVIVIVPILIWYYSNDAINEMLYGTFVHNWIYLKNSDSQSYVVNKLTNLSTTIILMFVINKRLKNENKELRNIVYFAAILTVIMLMFQRDYAHYYLILIPIISIFIAVLLNLYENEDKEYKFIYNLIIIFICIIYILPGILNSMCYLNFMKMVNLEEINDFVNLIPIDEKDEIFMFKHHLSSIYIYGDFLPSYKYAFLQSYLIKANPKIEDEILKYLEVNKNKWIISRNIDEFENKGKIDNYILENYEKYAEKELIRLSRFSYTTDEMIIYKYKNDK